VSAGRPHFEFRHGHGLGVLGHGAHWPPKVAALFAATNDDATADAIRFAYARLGRTMSDRCKLAAASHTIRSLSASLAAEPAENERLRGTLGARDTGYDGESGRVAAAGARNDEVGDAGASP